MASNCSRGGLCMKPAKNGHFATGILPAALVSPPKNRANLPRSRVSRGRKRKFPGFFASFLAFVYQYSISPPRERPPGRTRRRDDRLDEDRPEPGSNFA